ncbi:MAG: hypothetical protein QM477_07115, partial [Planctomycetota bacterium]
IVRIYTQTSRNKESDDGTVLALLARPDDFVTGPKTIYRDTSAKLSRGFFVRDRNYLSARWPGDIYAFCGQLLNMLQELEAP